MLRENCSRRSVPDRKGLQPLAPDCRIGYRIQNAPGPFTSTPNHLIHICATKRHTHTVERTMETANLEVLTISFDGVIVDAICLRLISAFSGALRDNDRAKERSKAVSKGNMLANVTRGVK